MGTNMYLYQKARETYYQDLVREMEKKRVLARLPRQRWSMSRCTVGKLGMLLLRLGSRLKQFEQSHTALDRKDEVPFVSTQKGAVAMMKLAVRYTRYAVSMLASIGFLASSN